jgi:hypothetical protein
VARPVRARRGLAWRGRRGLSGPGLVRFVKARQAGYGWAWQGVARFGRLGESRHGPKRRGTAGKASLGEAWRSVTGHLTVLPASLSMDTAGRIVGATHRGIILAHGNCFPWAFRMGVNVSTVRRHRACAWCGAFMHTDRTIHGQTYQAAELAEHNAQTAARGVSHGVCHSCRSLLLIKGAKSVLSTSLFFFSLLYPPVVQGFVA